MSIGPIQNRFETQAGPEAAIDELLERLEELCPREMAKALATLEFYQRFADKPAAFNPHNAGEISVYFSRGLKNEIQSIYSDLAKHLKAQHQDAHLLMDRVFEFFDETLKFLVQSPLLVSEN